jgi:hypothetical protein
VEKQPAEETGIEIKMADKGEGDGEGFSSLLFTLTPALL